MTIVIVIVIIHLFEFLLHSHQCTIHVIDYLNKLIIVVIGMWILIITLLHTITHITTTTITTVDQVLKHP